MRERRPGVWELRAYVGVRGGKKRSISRTFRGGKRDAAKALAALETQVDAGRVDPTLKMTVSQLLDRYIASRSGDWSPTTRRDHPATMDRWIRPVIGDMDIARVRPMDIEDLVNEIAVDHPATARKVLAILRSAFEDAIRWDLVTRNPARSARRPKAAKPSTKAPPLPLVRAAIAAADPGMAIVVRLAVVSGCRRGELLGLRWGDVDLDAGVIVVSRSIAETGVGPAVAKSTKTGRVKVIPLDDRTVVELRRWRRSCAEGALAFGVPLGDEHYLFAQRPDGVEPWSPSTLTHRWRALADTNGLPGVRFHDLRHATATTMIAGGIDPKTAADRLGHDPSVMLGIYTHAVPASGAARSAADVIAGALDQAG